MLIGYLAAGFPAGLLMNYLADVLPRTRSLSTPLWWPLKGDRLQKYFASVRVILVFLGCFVVSTLLYQNPPTGFPVSVLAVILMYFGVVTVIDIEHRLVMHSVSIGGGVLLGAIGLWRHGLVPTLLGALVGFAIMLGVYFLGDGLGRWLARRRGVKWEETALGFGDVNLVTVIGLLMGYPGVLAALVVGVFSAGVFSLFYMAGTALMRRFQAFASIPYAPFLCLGAVLTILLSIY